MAFDGLQRVLIVGLGESGQAAARLAAADGARVRVTDSRSADELGAILDRLPPGTETFLGGHPASCLDDTSLIVTSPGVPPDLDLLRTARQRRVPLYAEVEFAWQHRPDATLVGVTGSNGKSTVTALTATVLADAGQAAVAGGNLGPPASELVLQGGWDTWVLELSSFQCELFTALRPRVGIFLNLSQDHLERHSDLAAYGAAKARLFAHQTADDAAVVNADDRHSMAAAGIARRLLFSLEGRADAFLDGDQLILGDQPLVHRSALGLAGAHNIANALAAALAARELGATPAQIATTLSRFAGLAHRHQTVLDEQGVRWVDDSKATNVGATVAGLRGYGPSTVHLILGGLGKGQDFTPLREAVAGVAAHLYLIGADASRIGRALAGTAPMSDCGTLEEAVRRIRSAVRSGQTVLLAPACASFDQFSNYVERGERFAALARGEGGECH